MQYMQAECKIYDCLETYTGGLLTQWALEMSMQIVVNLNTPLT